MKAAGLYDLEAEKIIVAAGLFRGEDAIGEALQAGIEFRDFYDEKNRIVFKCLFDLATAGKSLDESSLKNALEKRGQFDKVGFQFFASLEILPTAVKLAPYIDRILESSRKRQLLSAVENYREVIDSGNGNLENAISDIGEKFAALRIRGGKKHSFEQLADDRFRITIPETAITLEVDRLRRERNQLVGELRVSCKLPGVPTHDGSLSIADFNLSSDRARSERANSLLKQAKIKALDWHGYLEEFCQRVLAAERNGQPAIDIRTISRPDPDDAIYEAGIRLPRRHSTIIFGDGGAAKSYLALYLAGLLSQKGHTVGFFDWELAGEDHRDRHERLYGENMPSLIYARCERPLVYEADRLRRIVQDSNIDFAIYDSVAFACDGPPESAEVAGRYFRAVRQIGVGSLHVAHVTKDAGGDLKPFGSVFWHNGARSTYFVKLSDSSPDGKTLSIGLFNRKANLGKLCPPVGFLITFTDTKTYFTEADPADTPELAEKMTIRQRLEHLLRNGGQPIERIADILEVKPDSVRRTVGRYRRQFTILQGGQVALLQQDK